MLCAYRIERMGCRAIYKHLVAQVLHVRCAGECGTGNGAYIHTQFLGVAAVLSKAQVYAGDIACCQTCCSQLSGCVD